MSTPKVESGHCIVRVLVDLSASPIKSTATLTANVVEEARTTAASRRSVVVAPTTHPDGTVDIAIATDVPFAAVLRTL